MEQILPDNTLLRFFSIIRIFTIIILVLALGDNAYSYYNFLRWTVCIVAVYWAYESHSQLYNGWAVTFSVIALLFNPIIPVHLDRGLWAVIDLGVAAIIGASILILDKPAESGTFKRRNIYGVILWVSLLVAGHLTYGIADFMELLIYAWVSFVAAGFIIAALEFEGSLFKKQDVSVAR